MKTKLFLLVFLLFVNNILLNDKILGAMPEEIAPGNISGKILDQSSSTPMEYVTVVLFSVSDSSMVSGTITDADGKFTISGISFGDYYLEINFLGFEKKTIPQIVINRDNSKITLPDISLAPVSTALNEVNVTGEKAKIEYLIDKRIVNVDKNISAQGGNAIDALENTPSVQVDAEGNLTLRGSSDYVVLVDGKPSIIGGSNALKQIPADNIAQIEVITNPSAKYDVDGQAGIINVILKKDKMQGLSGNVNVSASTSDRTNASALINYRKKKFNYFVGVDFADNVYKSDISTLNLTIYPDRNQYITENINQYYNNDNLAFKGGFDFDLNEKQSFSFSGSVGRQGYDQGNNARYHRWDNLALDAYNTSRNVVDITGDVLSFTADYHYNIGDNHSLSVSAYYSSWDGLDDNLLAENLADASYNTGDISMQLNHIKDNWNYQFRANIDYVQPLKTGKFEAGAQYRYEYRYEGFTFKNYDVPTSTWIKSDMYSYELNYMNAIYSGYAMFSGKLIGVDYQVGVRSEYFARNIDIDTEGEPLEFNKFMLYPSVHFSKSINEKHQFQLSYGRRINRPQPWLLNNTPSYIDPYNVFMGDPNLKFEYADAFEFNYRVVFKKVTLSTQTYYRYTTNSFTELRLLGNDGVMTHKLTNADSQIAFGVEQGIDVNIFKWWQLNTNANVYNYTLKTNVTGSELKQQVTTWDARVNSNFNLKKGTRIQATGYYRAPSVDAMGENSGFFVCNFAVNQSFMKGKLRAGLSAENILNTIKFDYSVANEQFNNKYTIHADGPIFVASLNYTFNNFQQKRRGRNDDIDFGGGGGF